MVWRITPSNLLVDDPDALTYLAAVEAADGQALESGVRLAVNAFVKGCKEDGIWPAIKASCILAGARTLAGTLVPLVGPAPTTVLTGYNRKIGLIGNSSNILNTNYRIPSGNQNNVHGAAYVTSQMTVFNNTLVGNSDGGYFGFYPANANRYVIACNSAGGTTTVDVSGIGSSLGLAAISRNGSTGFEYSISNLSGVVSQQSSAPLNANIHLYGGNSSPNYASNARIAFYSIGEWLDLSLLRNRVTALINALAAAIP